MKIAEIRERDNDALRHLERELVENLFALRLQKHTGQLENVAKITSTRRDLARVKTVMRARALGHEVQAEPGSAAAEAAAKAPEKKTKKKTTKKAAKKKTTKKKAAKKKTKKKATKKKG